MNASAKYSRRGMQCLREAGAAVAAHERARLLEASQRWFDLAIHHRDLNDAAALHPPADAASRRPFQDAVGRKDG